MATLQCFLNEVTAYKPSSASYHKSHSSLSKYLLLFSSSLKTLGNQTLFKTPKSTSLSFTSSISFFIESDAMLIILKNLKGFNRFLCFILGLTPKFFRDFFYRIISKNRYKIFGNKTYCNHKEYNEYIERFFQ